MDPLNTSASVAALLVLTGTVVHYLKAFKGASQDSQKILLEIRSVSRLLYQLKEILDNAEEDELSYKTIKSLSVPEGPVEQFKTSLEILASKLQPVSGWRKAGKVLTWPFRKEEINEILRTIERQKTLFGLALENDHIALSQAIKEDLTEIQTVVSKTQVGVKDIQAGVAELRVARKDSDEEKVLRWLATTDPSFNHSAARTKHQPTTGDWLLRSEEFQSWWTKPSWTLWLYGIPGSGKTVLLSTVVNHVKGLCSSVPDVGYAYFYFTFRDELKQTTEGFLRCIIMQLSSQRPSLPEEVRNLFDEYGRQQQAPPLPTLVHVLFSLLQSSRKTYLMIDALDECSEQDVMLDLLTQISTADKHSANTGVLITSRRERSIEIILQDIVTNSICIQSELIKADIRLHVRSRLLHDPKLKRHSGSVKAEIEGALCEGAHGMFRWVDCQLESLKKSLSPASIRRALKSLPKTLEETYDRILASIEGDYREAAHAALQWLAFSRRPLYLKEIVEVIAVVIGGSTEFKDDRLSDPHDVLGICSSLVTISDPSSDRLSENLSEHVSEASSAPSADTSSASSSFQRHANTLDEEASDQEALDEEAPQIYLAHYSVKEYLTSDRILAGPASAFAISEIAANRSITELCLRYLSFFDSPDTLTGESLTAFPLLGYAARFWFEHARTANEEMGLGSVIIEFLKEAKSLTLLNRLVIDAFRSWKIVKFSHEASKNGSPLYHASYCGLSRSAAILIETGADVNAQGGYYGNSLQAAAVKNNVSVIKLLLEAGADVNAQSGHYGNALQAAAMRSDALPAIKLLLEAGADVNAQGGYYGNPLQAAAAETSSVTVIKLLLEAGAVVNAQGGYYGHPLQAAAVKNNVPVIKLLLEAGADVEAQGGPYGNALQAAARPSGVSVIKLLVEAGADVNAQGGPYGNALQAAARHGNVSVVKLLLDEGADVKSQGGLYGNALQAAARKSDVSVIKLLLEEGADVNAEGGLFGNALQAAAYYECKENFELLLEHGAVVTQEGNFDRPWDAARYAAEVAMKRWDERFAI